MGWAQAHKFQRTCWTPSGVCHTGSYKSVSQNLVDIFLSSHASMIFDSAPAPTHFYSFLPYFYLCYHQILLTHLSSIPQNLLFTLSLPLATHIQSLSKSSSMIFHFEMWILNVHFKSWVVTGLLQKLYVSWSILKVRLLLTLIYVQFVLPTCLFTHTSNHLEH